MQQSPYWKEKITQIFKQISCFLKSESILHFLQKVVTILYPKRDKSIPQLKIVSCKIHFNSIIRYPFNFFKDIYPAVLPMKSLYALLISPKRDTQPVHLIRLRLST